jgi:hypothetical protein
MKTCCPYQRGGSLRGFAGPEWQVGGKSSFGRFIWRHARPLLRFLGKQALYTGLDVGNDVRAGQPIKESLKSRGKEIGRTIARKVLSKAEDQLSLLDNEEDTAEREEGSNGQGGSGKRRRPKRGSRKTTRKSIKGRHMTRRTALTKRRPNTRQLRDIFENAW